MLIPVVPVIVVEMGTPLLKLMLQMLDCAFDMGFGF